MQLQKTKSQFYLLGFAKLMVLIIFNTINLNLFLTWYEF
jgi:hypothetical protein